MMVEKNNKKNIQLWKQSFFFIHNGSKNDFFMEREKT